MGLPTTTFKMLKCYFTEDEMKEFMDKLASSVMEKQTLVDEKKSVVSDYTARINEKDATINRVASNIRNGYEHREVKCQITYDFDRRIKTFAREDTGEVVQEEVITPDECQQEIPGLQAIDHDAFIEEGQRLIDELDDSLEELPTDEADDEPITSDPADLPEPPLGSDAPELRMISNGWVRKVHDDFIAQMNAAKTANEGREIIRAYEDRLNQLQRVAAVEPVCGSMNRIKPKSFSSLSKKEINAICKEVSKSDPGIGMIHTAIVEQWPKINERWEQLLEEEHQARTEN